MALTVFGQRPKTEIFQPQIPYAIRNDCQAGQWKIGDDDFRGNSLEMSIVKVSQMFGTLGKTRNALWLQVWFIPAPGNTTLPANTVTVTHIKTRSISQFSSLITELMADGEPAEGIFTAAFEKHSGVKGNYYSLAWDWRKRGTPEELGQLEKIVEFMETEPVLVDLTTGLQCIDSLTTEEIEDLIRSAKSEEFPEEIEPPQPKTAALARRR